MAQRERLSEIRQTVKRNKKVLVSQLSKEYGVTEETIRRDLEKLEQEGLITRTHGGAVLNMYHVSEHIEYLRRAQTNKDEKQTIGRLTAEIIPTGVSLGVDSSSTGMEAISLLRDRRDITVLTNSVKIVRELDQAALTVISTGGVINNNTFSMQGSIARNTINEYYLDYVLISCTGMSLDGGIFDSNEEEAAIKRVLIQRGQKIILMVDHTKFDKYAFVRVLGFDQLEAVVTDRKPDDEWLELFEEKGIDLYYPMEEERKTED
ncbi:MAG: DeoR/GlpR family DNA-binding transcription regulator [Lachnospiraceae bacterium]|nr:DeoR/GlpR family DNA-binding transcription regulator [Lachnospiraceae bacterium]